MSKNNQKIVKKTLKKASPASKKQKPKTERSRREDMSRLAYAPIRLPQMVVGQIADEVVKRLRRGEAAKEAEDAKSQKIENAIFLDTSAIIDGRFFELAEMGVFHGTYVVLSGVVTELKRIADSRDPVKRERGRAAFKELEKFKKAHKSHFVVISVDDGVVDDQIVKYAKMSEGRVVTCDYNLTQKAKIEGVAAIDLYALANVLKTPAIPGEKFRIKIVQEGKGERQGVGYLDDGTMIVVEEGEEYIDQEVGVVVSRVIQTEAGKILFAKIE